MIEFSHLILVITLILIKEIACSDSLQAALPSYYDSGTQQQLTKEWQKYQRAFENAVISQQSIKPNNASIKPKEIIPPACICSGRFKGYRHFADLGLQENFGSSAVNIYVAGRHDSQLLAKGFLLTDGVVNVYFFQMLLRELPALVRPKLNIELASNHLKFQSKVGRMFIDATYFVARNTSSVMYLHPEDQKMSSPFSLQQVDSNGKVAIIAEDCLLSGLSIIMMNGESLNVGHTPIQLSDCKFTVEISTPDSGAPPVIAPYFPKGPKEKLELILGKPIVAELKTKLQGAMYSYVNTTVLFGDKVSNFRDNQQKLFASYANFIKNYVSDLNKKILQVNKKQVRLEDYDVLMDTTSADRRHSCHLSLTGLVLYGMETAYVSRTGGPYKDGASDTAADAIVFSSMQIRGKVTHDDNGIMTYDFAAEITDVTVNIVISIGKGGAKLQNISLAGWRSLEFSIIPWKTHFNDRISYEALVHGHILNVLPTRIISHLKSVLEDIPSDDEQQDSGGGSDNSGDKSKEDDDDKNNTNDNDKKHSSSIEPSSATGIDDDDDKKKKEFFTDDLLDKDFFTDDNLDKKFFSDDIIKKDFLSDDHIKDNPFSDDKTSNGKDVSQQTDIHTEGDVEKNENSGDEVDEGVTDNIANDEDTKNKNDSDKKAEVESSDIGDHEVGDGDDNKDGVDDNRAVADADSGGNTTGMASDISSGPLVGSISGENTNSDGDGQVSGADVDVSENVGDDNRDGTDVIVSEGKDDEGSENNESRSIEKDKIEKPSDNNSEGVSDDSSKVKKDFFTDDNLEKDFFSDDKDFFTDGNIKKDFTMEVSLTDKDDASNNDDASADAEADPKETNNNDASSSNNDDASVDDGVDGKKSTDNNSSNNENASVNENAEENENKKILSNKKNFLDENFFSDNNIDKRFLAEEMRRHSGKDNATANITNQTIDVTKYGHKDDDISRETTGIANLTNKNVGSKEVKRNVLPLNVHNARRFDNLDMSENEIH